MLHYQPPISRNARPFSGGFPIPNYLNRAIVTDETWCFPMFSSQSNITLLDSTSKVHRERMRPKGAKQKVLGWGWAACWSADLANLFRFHVSSHFVLLRDSPIKLPTFWILLDWDLGEVEMCVHHFDCFFSGIKRSCHRPESNSQTWRNTNTDLSWWQTPLP